MGPVPTQPEIQRRGATGVGGGGEGPHVRDAARVLVGGNHRGGAPAVVGQLVVEPQATGIRLEAQVPAQLLAEIAEQGLPAHLPLPHLRSLPLLLASRTASPSQASACALDLFLGLPCDWRPNFRIDRDANISVHQ